MNLALILLVVITGTAMAVFCAVCAVKPEKIASYARDRHLRSGKWSTRLPFSGIVMKRWYPTYVRWVGLVGFLCTLLWLDLVLRHLVMP